MPDQQFLLMKLTANSNYLRELNLLSENLIQQSRKVNAAFEKLFIQRVDVIIIIPIAEAWIILSDLGM